MEVLKPMKLLDDRWSVMVINLRNKSARSYTFETKAEAMKFFIDYRQ